MTEPEKGEAEPIPQVLNRLPNRMRRFLEWLLRPERRWFRLPVAILLIAGGALWFLPLLGFWMMPLGLILLAEDIPPLKRWVARFLRRIEKWSRGSAR